LLLLVVAVYLVHGKGQCAHGIIHSADKTFAVRAKDIVAIVRSETGIAMQLTGGETMKLSYDVGQRDAVAKWYIEKWIECESEH
jgi:hypothetical protein